jgi:hypothetical protein
VLLDENDEDDVAGHRMRAAEPGFISGALTPDDSLPSSKRSPSSDGPCRDRLDARRRQHANNHTLQFVAG